jgi:outer membrane biosynthesis protein TonB
MRKSNGKGPTSKQRTAVWRGDLAKTSGGLTKADLTKNKRGKIVSRRKSHQASHTNNLGDWLRESGVSVGKGEMLRRKGSPPEGLKTEKQEGAQAPAKAQKLPQKAHKIKKVAAAQVKPKKAAAKPKQAPPKPKPVPKPAPKKVAAKPKRVPKRKPAKAAKKPAKPKKGPKANVNPITGKRYVQKVGKAKAGSTNIDLDNVIVPGLEEQPVDYSAFY